MTLSSPKASSTRLVDTTPEAIAVMASITIQPIVIHSSRNAAWISGLRSTAGSVGKIKGSGTQHASSQASPRFLDTCHGIILPRQLSVHQRVDVLKKSFLSPN